MKPGADESFRYIGFVPVTPLVLNNTTLLQFPGDSGMIGIGIPLLVLKYY